MVLETHAHRVPPVRGLVLAHSAEGKPYALAGVERWLRLCRFGFHLCKVDVLDNHAAFDVLPELLNDAHGLELRVSLRTDCSHPPERLSALREAGLFDVFLTPNRWDDVRFDAWLNASREAGLAIRVQFLAPLTAEAATPARVDRLAAAGVVAVNLALQDPFARAVDDSPGSRTTLDVMKSLVPLLEERGIETNVVRVPFCLMPEALWPNVVNRAQFYQDHQQYERCSYELAVKLWERSPVWGNKAVTMLLGRHTSFRDPLDAKLFPWILERPWLRARVWALQKLTRHTRFFKSAPGAVEPAREAHARVQEREHAARRGADGHPECASCSLVRVCDHAAPEVLRLVPGANIRAQHAGDAVWALHFAARQRKHYDAVDAERRDRPFVEEALADEANGVMTQQPPTREIGSLSYEVEGQWCSQTESAVRWYSHTNSEKLSTPLGTFAPPFTVSVTIGGGIAEYAGFAVGRESRVMCPMVAYSHRIALHVAEDGRYVLLRDGVAVRPTEFSGFCGAPVRLGSLVEPRIALCNIDGSIATQSVFVWEGAGDAENEHGAIDVKYSVIIVCTRYSRRLQAVLRSIAHQQDIDLGLIEAVVAYVPGLDATDDLLDSVGYAYPKLRVVRSPFAKEKATSKGFLINESIRLARGKWIVLLDADTLIPPAMFAEIEKVEDSSSFIVPGGRKMLPPDVTAAILMGEVEPWRCWSELLDGPGEMRVREAMDVPIGFCQCVRASCFDKVRYVEFDHFEAADSRFAQDLRGLFGDERRLEGVPVLHLDHGGSHWYGSDRQR